MQVNVIHIYSLHLPFIAHKSDFQGLGGWGGGVLRGGGGRGQGVVVLQLCSLLSAVVQFSLVI